nr:CAAX prenyl protease 2 [Ipomoea batatas]
MEESAIDGGTFGTTGVSKWTAVIASISMALFYVAILYSPTLILRLPPPDSFKSFMIRRFICAAISTVASLIACSLILPIELDASDLLSAYGIRADHFVSFKSDLLKLFAWHTVFSIKHAQLVKGRSADLLFLFVTQWQAAVFPLSLTALMYAGSLLEALLLLVSCQENQGDVCSCSYGVFVGCMLFLEVVPANLFSATTSCTTWKMLTLKMTALSLWLTSHVFLFTFMIKHSKLLSGRTSSVAFSMEEDDRQSLSPVEKAASSAHLNHLLGIMPNEEAIAPSFLMVAGLTTFAFLAGLLGFLLWLLFPANQSTSCITIGQIIATVGIDTVLGTKKDSILDRDNAGVRYEIQDRW